MHKLFTSQADDEKIYMVLRQHWLLPALRLGVIFLVFVMLTAIWWWLRISSGFLSADVEEIFDMFYFSALLLLLFGALMVFTLYYLSLQIITDRRLVDVDQHSIFSRKVTEIQIENMQEPTSRTVGFLATFFDYGNVLVQTSSAVAEFEFDHVPHPEQVKKLIMDLYEQNHHDTQQSQARAHAAAIQMPRPEPVVAQPLDTGVK